MRIVAGRALRAAYGGRTWRRCHPRSPPPHRRLAAAELPDDQRALDQFKGAVIDRLFALNAKRAEEEKRLGQAKVAATKAMAAPKAKRAPAKKGGKAGKKGEAGQGGLFGEEE